MLFLHTRVGTSRHNSACCVRNNVPFGSKLMVPTTLVVDYNLERAQMYGNVEEETRIFNITLVKIFLNLNSYLFLLLNIFSLNSEPMQLCDIVFYILKILELRSPTFIWFVVPEYVYVDQTSAGRGRLKCEERLVDRQQSFCERVVGLL